MVYSSLSERQKLILALIIREYAQSAQPVGSKRLLELYGLEISSATIRNEMSTLADLGYLRQPHTSAGRVPTEEGYRYFVGELMGHSDLPAPTKRTITHQFYQAPQGVDQWMRLAASILANQTKSAALVTAPHPSQPRFKHIELIDIRNRQVLMVLVLMGGEVRQQMLSLPEPVPQPKLSAIANEINQHCYGLDFQSILNVGSNLDALGQDIIKLVHKSLQVADRNLAGEIYRDGIVNMLAEPEFAEPDTARKAMRVLEERPLLEDLISQTIMKSDIGVVQVLIGGEGNWDALSEFSVVLARYGIPDMATGMVGVMGPIRMQYGQSISVVRFIAELLSDLVIETYAE